jgi:radical SAM superfamily enzyme YgiQ (UPF0313 family)
MNFIKKVVFVQLPAPRFGFEEPPANIPLAAGYLTSALKNSELRSEIIPPDVLDVYADSALVQKILERDPDVVGFTLYVWNVERSLYIASMLKQAKRDIRILIGGPETTPDNSWVLDHPAVDAGIFGEGESRMATVTRELLGGGKSRTIPDAFIGKFRPGRASHLVSSYELKNLANPYLEEFIDPARDGTIFLETVRGCPYRCKYCYYHKSFKDLRAHDWEELKRTFEWIYSNGSDVKEIYLMDPTFNSRRGFRRVLKFLLHLRKRKDVRLHAELRADLLTSYDVELLRDAGLKTAEVGLQTTNPAALKLAGRRGDLSDLSAGISLLKDAGIEVTTGIIIGLPGDTPETFKGTLDWLVKEQAYSVVHPFMLSVLPGTDFRRRARTLLLKYQQRPPYYVLSTPTFSKDDFRPAMEECENVFDMEIDYIAPPSLVDKGPGVAGSAGRLPYVSKWIIHTYNKKAYKQVREVIPRAGNPFTFWFKGAPDFDGMKYVLTRFSEANPHALIHIVLESPEPAETSVMEKLLAITGNPELYVNRSFYPLHEQDEIVSVNFSFVLKYPTTAASRKSILKKYGQLGHVVWSVFDLPAEKLVKIEPPVLIEWGNSPAQEEVDGTLRLLAETHKTRPEEVLFRNESIYKKWKKVARGIGSSAMLSEQILVSD